MNNELINLERQLQELQVELEASLASGDTAAMVKAKSKMKKLRAQIEIAQREYEQPSSSDEKLLQTEDFQSDMPNFFDDSSSNISSIDLELLRHRLSVLSLSDKARLEHRTSLLVEEMVARNSSNGEAESMTSEQILLTASQSIIAELEELEAKQTDELLFEESKNAENSQEQIHAENSPVSDVNSEVNSEAPPNASVLEEQSPDKKK